MHDTEGFMSSNTIELIKTLPVEPSAMSHIKLGFPVITKTTFD